MAERQGYQLRKSRRRDPRAVDYGRYFLTDPATNGLATSEPFGVDLDDVDAFLNGAAR
jgi:hypothetical protein